MRLVRRRTVLLGIAAVAVAACTTNDGPTDPVWGKEPCAHCRMLVSEKRYAAQALANGDRKYFDDIGCMALWLADKKAERTWVRDANEDRWLEAAQARYVRGAKTPMDFGFEARAQGELGWDEVRGEVAAKRGAR